MKPKQQVVIYESIISISFALLKKFGFKEVFHPRFPNRIKIVGEAVVNKYANG
eukprot:gnl/Chilomastix_caulleri/7118.p1 GENE.gnl/Chilomastix_caulleri/7118~~gnl/Chilomastix_caulleri/7118.p1  ORF type:complete len:53 (+),score=4.89 gnl/Chilomastix_caulleri/7118:153-311(+)